MKRISFVWLIALCMAIAALAAGCGADGSESGGQAPPSSGQNAQGGEGDGHAPAEQPVQDDRVVVSRSIDFASVNDRPFGVFEAKKEIAAFAKAIRTAKKLNGQLDVDFPDYDVVIDQNGKRKSIHLWLDQKRPKGMFTYVSDTGTGYTLTEQSTKELVELIWGIEYDSEKAATNGDVVAKLSGEVLNPDEWLTFVNNLQNGQQDEVQVVHYTIEGGPIFHNLIYYNGDSFRLRYDNSHDAFGTPVDHTDFCEGIQSEETDRGTVYTLKGCSEKNTWLELVLPGK